MPPKFRTETVKKVTVNVRQQRMNRAVPTTATTTTSIPASPKKACPEPSDTGPSPPPSKRQKVEAKTVASDEEEDYVPVALRLPVQQKTSQPRLSYILNVNEDSLIAMIKDTITTELSHQMEEHGNSLRDMETVFREKAEENSRAVTTLQNSFTTIQSNHKKLCEQYRTHVQASEARVKRLEKAQVEHMDTLRDLTTRIEALESEMVRVPEEMRQIHEAAFAAVSADYKLHSDDIQKLHTDFASTKERALADRTRALRDEKLLGSDIKQLQQQVPKMEKLTIDFAKIRNLETRFGDFRAQLNAVKDSTNTHIASCKNNAKHAAETRASLATEIEKTKTILSSDLKAYKKSTDETGADMKKLTTRVDGLFTRATNLGEEINSFRPTAAGMKLRMKNVEDSLRTVAEAQNSTDNRLAESDTLIRSTRDSVQQVDVVSQEVHMSLSRKIRDVVCSFTEYREKVAAATGSVALVPQREYPQAAGWNDYNILRDNAIRRQIEQSNQQGQMQGDQQAQQQIVPLVKNKLAVQQQKSVQLASSAFVSLPTGNIQQNDVSQSFNRRRQRVLLPSSGP